MMCVGKRKRRSLREPETGTRSAPCLSNDVAVVPGHIARDRGLADGGGESGAGSLGQDSSDPRTSGSGSSGSGSSGSGSGSGSSDGDAGHLVIAALDAIGPYTVVQEAGTGTFGKVYHVRHSTSGAQAAVKVVRGVAKYTDAAEVEARLLSVVNQADPDHKSRCVRFLHHFMHGEHVCMAFELLGPSVFDYMKKNRFQPLPLFVVHAFAEQLVWSVAFLHAMELVHTDLKPENMLLVPTSFSETRAETSARDGRAVLTPNATGMRLIDFGGATFEHQRKSSVVSTRQYRAPEVILGCGWGAASDMWSVGCILMEMYTGELLFATHNNLEHLALIEACVGPVPAHMKGSRKTDRAASAESRHHVAKMRRLKDIVHRDDAVFLDLVQRCLCVDPAKRITARKAVNHVFFTAARGYRKPPQPAVTLSPERQAAFDDLE